MISAPVLAGTPVLLGRTRRDPQHTGAPTALTGAATTRRSPAATTPTAALATVCRARTPTGEGHLADHLGAPCRDHRSRTPRRPGRPTTVDDR